MFQPILHVIVLLTSTMCASAAALAADQSQPAPSAVPSLLDRHAATQGFTLGRPGSITVTPDGDAVLFLRSAGPTSTVQSLYSFDVATAKESLLLSAEKLLGGTDEKLSPEELARRERMRMTTRGISGYSLSKDGTLLLVPLSGELYVVTRATGTVKKLPRSDKFPIDPSLSPDGKLVACARENDLYVTDIATGVEKRLTTAKGESITNGVAEFAAQEEMARTSGYWWSPDSAFIAYQQNDDTALEMFHIADPSRPEVPPQSWRYPRAGKANTKVKLGVMPAVGGETVWVKWDDTKYPYLATVKWPKGAPLTILVQNREQTEEVLMKVDPKTGATTTLLVEKDDAWLNLDQSMPRWLEDGTGFLWSTEREGSDRLELRSADGTLVRPLAGSDDGFQAFISLDETHGNYYYNAYPNASQRRVYRGRLSGPREGGNERWSDAPGIHGMIAPNSHKAFVMTLSTPDARQEWRVFDGSSKEVGQLTNLAERPNFDPAIELTSIGGDKQIRAVLIRPRTFDKAKKYPVLLNVYAGPTALMATAVRRSIWLDQGIADQGYIIVSIDGRGTPGRSREWERCIKGNFIDIQLDDQVAGLKLLCDKYPELDAARIGVYGWSFGGYFSAMATMRRGDIFKAGVAGAPVCDWADYDTHYTERYIGTPESNPKGYAASDVSTYASELKSALMIIHGTADDNVYFMHSLKLTGALMLAGKPFEFVPLPGKTHVVKDPETIKAIYTRMISFFDRELKK